MATNVPALDWSDEGLILPSEPDILNGVLADINSAFGGGLNLQLTTPQGQLAQTITAIIGDKNSEFAQLINLINPLTSYGIYQDAIGKIYFMSRLAGTGTVVTCQVTGKVDTVIPAGTLVQDTKGYNYKSLSEIKIGSNNKGQGQFQNVKSGPIGCAPNTLTRILQAIQGWETITNENAGILGREVESRSDFETRRKNSVNIVGSGNIYSIRAAVLALTDVVDCYAYSNDTGQDITLGTTKVPVKASTIYIAVVGGEDKDVAMAIFNKKSSGCGYTGNTSVTITYPDYPDPAPTTTVTFQRPTATNVYFAVSIENDGSLPTGIEDSIKTAIINRFDGADGSERVHIGQSIYASNYYSAITILDESNLNILSLTIGLSENPTTTVTTLGVDQAPVVSVDTITVTLIPPAKYSRR